MRPSIKNSNLEESFSSVHPAVSIIVPCRNEKEQIETTLQSILVQEPPAGGFEVIVADGMSDDETRNILSELTKENRRLRIVDNPGRIVSTGLNAAIGEARGSVIMRMDAHTTYASDYVRNCLQVLQTTGADNVGGAWVAKGTGIISRTIAAALQSPFSFGSTRGHNPNYEGTVDTVYLGCWPRHVFDRVGMFDEELVRNQDDEFNLRLTRVGGKIWQSPRIRSWYRPRGSIRALFRQYMQYGYWKVRVIQKHRIPASVRHLIPGAFVLSLVLLTLAAPWSGIAAWCWIALLGLYFVCNLVASILTAARFGWMLFPLLPLVFASCHFPYGFGFLRGIWDFVILRRAPSHKYTELTRTREHNLAERRIVSR
jgi:succinoglycan biosynthesis protein ExoA